MSAIRLRAIPFAVICFAALLALGCGAKRVEETEPVPTPESPDPAAVKTGDVEEKAPRKAAEKESETESSVARATGDPVVVDAVYVVVDKHVITVSEIVRKVEPIVQTILESNPALSDAERSEVRSHVFAQVAESMIVKALILKAAREKGLSVDEARVGSQIRRLQVKEGLSLEEYLEKSNMTYRELYREVHDDILFSGFRQIEIVPRVNVAPSEIKAYFEAHKDEAEFLTPEQVHCHEIVLFGSDEGKRQKAAAALEKLHAGAEFAEVAGEFSENTSTVRSGGDRGWIARNVINSEKVNRVLFDELKVGDASDVIEDENGFLWIVMISGRREATRASLDEAYAKIERRLRRIKIEQETRKYTQRLRKTTSIVFPNEIRR